MLQLLGRLLVRRRSTPNLGGSSCVLKLKPIFAVFHATNHTAWFCYISFLTKIALVLADTAKPHLLFSLSWFRHYLDKFWEASWTVMLLVNWHYFSVFSQLSQWVPTCGLKILGKLMWAAQCAACSIGILEPKALEGISAARLHTLAPSWQRKEGNILFLKRNP